MTYEENILNIANNVLSLEQDSEKIDYLTQEKSSIENPLIVEHIEEIIISLSN